MYTIEVKHLSTFQDYSWERNKKQSQHEKWKGGWAVMERVQYIDNLGHNLLKQWQGLLLPGSFNLTAQTPKQSEGKPRMGQGCSCGSIQISWLSGTSKTKQWNTF